MAQSTSVNDAKFLVLKNAIQANDHAKVEALTADATLLNVQNSSGATALIVAVEEENLALVKLLIELGAKVNGGTLKPVVRNRGGIGTPLSVAARQRPLSGIAKYLIEQGADLNAYGSDGLTPLVQATKENIASVQLLLSSGALVNEPDSAGFTPLDYTLGLGPMKDQARTTALLLSHGAKMGRTIISKGNSRKREPLLVAVVTSDIEMIKQIGAETGRKNPRERIRTQALKIAMLVGDYPVINALKQNSLWPESSYITAREAVRLNDARTLQMVLEESPELLSTKYLPLTDQFQPKSDPDYNGQRNKNDFLFDNAQFSWLSYASHEGYSDKLIDVLNQAGVTDNTLVSYSVGSQMQLRATHSSLEPYRRSLDLTQSRYSGPKLPLRIAYEQLIKEVDDEVIRQKGIHDDLRKRLGCTSAHYNICQDP